MPTQTLVSERTVCPKCQGACWFERFDVDVVQRCLCGLRKYVTRNVDGVLIQVPDMAPHDMVLPARRTKIYKCFVSIGHRHPGVIKTAEIARDTGLKNKETAALLNALMSRGLIDRASERRGIAGGSEWKLTPRATHFFVRHAAARHPSRLS